MARNAKNTRMCSGCMIRKDKSELVAVTKSSGSVSISMASDAPKGRSAYLCTSTVCMQKSAKKKWFARSLKCELPPEFYNKLEEFFINLNLE